VSNPFRPYEPDQAFLLPPSPADWLPKDHVAFFIKDIVGQLDLAAMVRVYDHPKGGALAYHPQMMVALLVYAYSQGITSSRKIERKTYEDVAFRVLAAGQHPDHSRISEFRRVHLKALADLFVQVLKLCRKAGMVKLGHVSLDGTKVKANASKHKAMSYGRMNEDEQKLQARVNELLRQAEKADAEEDREEGAGRKKSDLPEDLQHAQTRLERIRQLKAELEAEAANPPPPPPGSGGKPRGQEATELSPIPRHRIPMTPEGVPTRKAQRNFTDPESRMMKSTKDGFVQAYNCQAAVDSAHQVIVAQATGNQPPDVEYLIPMLERTRRNCGVYPKRLTADSGYYSQDNVSHAVQRGVDPYIATGRLKHHEEPEVTRKKPTAALTPKERMARKLATRRGSRIYAKRKTIPEPVFGQIKEVRGFRRFSMRGLEKASGEWAFVATIHNLMKLWRRTRPTG
jgi:transposase